MTAAPDRHSADGSGRERATLTRTTTTKQQAGAGGREHSQRRRFRNGGHAAERGRAGAGGRKDRAALGQERAVDQEVVIRVNRPAVVKVAVDPAGPARKEASVDLEV